MIKIKEINFIKFMLMPLMLLLWMSCQEPKPIPLDSPLPLRLSLEQEELDVLDFLKEMSARPDAAEVFRRILMKKALINSIRSRSAKIPQINLQEWQEKLPSEDADDAELYGLAAYIIHLESLTPQALEQRFKQMFPNAFRFIGRQVQLSPQQVWTEDHYQRNIGSLRSRARLKLTQLRHQLIEGADSAELAQRFSHHPSAQNQQGRISLDLLKKESFSPQVIRAVSSLRLGEISPILQDDKGMYLFINEGHKKSFTLEAEGVFFPKQAISTAQLQSPQFWQLLETLCDQSNDCELSQILPTGSVGSVWRDAWEENSSEGKLSQKQRKRRNRKKRKLSRKAKGDTRHLSGREKSWSSLSQELFKTSQAQYHARVSPQVFESFQLSSRSFFFERASLFKALPIVFTPQGAWLIRLKARTIFPQLNQGTLRLIALDLSKNGLKKHWKTWGFDAIGKQLKLAADQHRLDEALSTLGLSAHPIMITTLPAPLMKNLLLADLSTGPKVFYSSELPKTNSVLNSPPSSHHWTLVELIRKEKVSFSEVKQEVIADFEREMLNLKTLRGSLAKLWTSLKVTWQIDDEAFSFESASSRGFLR